MAWGRRARILTGHTRCRQVSFLSLALKGSDSSPHSSPLAKSQCPMHRRGVKCAG